MENLIAIVCICILVIPAIIYIVVEKRKGVKCIGCSSACNCIKKNSNE